MRVLAMLAVLPLSACMSTIPVGQSVLGTVSTNQSPSQFSNAASQDFVVGTESFAVILNDERGNVDLLPVVQNDQLMEAAQLHAEDMVENNYFSHTGLDGSTAVDRVLAVGYDYAFIAENLATGYTSEEAVMEAWMNSPGHAANIVDPRAADFGLGLEQDTWVLLLGDER